MTLDRRTRERMLAHCKEIHEDDGVDPREFFKPGRASGQENRKAKQLCRQVAETLEQVLAGETGEDLLRELHVMSVVPAPDSSRFLVTLAAGPGGGLFDRASIEKRLAAWRGRLRSEVSAAINRRKTPTLIFLVAGPLAAPADSQSESSRGGDT